MHHILTLYALGAAPDLIQQRYERNAAFQRPPPLLDQRIVKDLHDPDKFQSHLRVNNITYYHNYLVFFQNEIEEKGYKEVLDKYIFCGDDSANIVFARLFSGELTMHCWYGHTDFPLQVLCIHSFISDSVWSSSSLL